MSTHKRRSLLFPGSCAAALLVATAWTLAKCPRAAKHYAGLMLGTLSCFAFVKRRKIAARNLELCFPELDTPRRARLLRGCFRSLGLGAFEFITALWGRANAPCRIEGLDHLRQARAAGQGVILLSGHFFTLEICGRLLCDYVPLAGMYRPYRNPLLERAVKSARLRYASAMFARDEIRKAVKYVRGGGILWYAPDQDMRGKDKLFVPFFGIPAATITATHTLARLSGAKVMGFFHRRAEDGRSYVLRIEPALEDFPSGDAHADTARVSALIERMAREAPEEYMWIHRRFHRRPPGLPRLYE